MNRARIYTILKYMVFISFGVGLFYYVFQSQDKLYQAQCLQLNPDAVNCTLWTKLIEDLHRLNWFLIALVMLGFIISNLMRARRWVILLEPMGIQSTVTELYWALHLGYFANLALPRMGEIARAGAVSKRLKAPFEKVLGTIISDRLLDLVLLFIFTILAFLLQTRTLYNFLSKQASISIWHLFVGALIGLIGLAFLLFLFKTDMIYHPVIEKIKSKLNGLKDGILSLLKSNRRIETVFLSFGIWGMYYLMTLLGLKAFSPTSHITMVQGLVVFIIGSLSNVIPTPGGIGPFHFLTMSALGIYGISSIDGFSYANLSFIIVQVVTISIFGMLGMLFIAKTKHKIQP